MIRDIQRADAPLLFDLMQKEFPEESALLGNRPEGFERVVRRVFRWDTRLILGLLRLLGRPIFRMLAVEADGKLVGSTLVTFPRVSAWVSNVVVAPAYRRRGYARRMVEEARGTARRVGRQYVALDVLDSNTPARTLYESMGYRRLQAKGHFLLEPATAAGTAASGNPAIRPFRRPDARPLASIVGRQTPSGVKAVIPTGEAAFVASRLATRMLDSEGMAWVIDRGNGAEGYVAATVSKVASAAHVTAPVLSESLDPALGASLTRTACAWSATRGAPRILCLVSEHNTWGRAALESVGFRLAFSSQTLYRSVN